jgi:hypothetical protein
VASLHLLASQSVVTVNANNHMQVQTVSLDRPLSIPFNLTTQTLVVVLTTPVMAEGYIAGGGQVNTDAIDAYGEPIGQTFVGGGCLSDFRVSNSTTQWYVRLQGTSTYVSGSSSSDGFDDEEVIAIIIAGSVIAVALIGFSYYVMTKNRDKLSKRHVKLDGEDDSKL